MSQETPRKMASRILKGSLVLVTQSFGDQGGFTRDKSGEGSGAVSGEISTRSQIHIQEGESPSKTKAYISYQQGEDGATSTN